MTENTNNLTNNSRLPSTDINISDNSNLLGVINSSLTSAMEGYEETVCQQDKENAGFFEIFATFLGSVICVTNLVVIVVIFRGGKKLHKPTFYGICNLAVADLLAGLLLLWIFGLQKAVLPIRTPESELWQKSIWTVAIWSSMLSQLVIAMDRYCYVTNGHGGISVGGRYQGDKWRNLKRKRWIKAGIFATWVIPLFTIVLPVMTGWNCTGGCACYKLRNSTSNIYYMICSPLEKCSQMNPPFAKGTMLYVGVILIFMPIMPCILYAKIYHFVRTATKKFRPSCQPRPSKVNSFNSQDNELEKSCIGNDQDNQTSPNNSNTFVTSSSPSLEDRPASLPVKKDSQCLPKKRKISQVSWSERILNSPFIKPLRRKGSAYVEANAREADNEATGSVALRQSSGTVSKPRRSRVSKNNERRDLRLLYTLVIILVLFLISTVPLGILFIISFTETDKSYVQAAKILLTASLFNSMVNPWIYFWRFPEIRSAIHKMFCSCCVKCKKSKSSFRRESVSTKCRGDFIRSYTEGALDYTPGEATRRGSRTDTGSNNSAL